MAVGNGPGAPHVVSAALVEVARRFLTLWQEVHDRPGRAPCAVVEGGVLTVGVADALTAAEVRAARRPGGVAALQRALDRQVDAIYPKLAQVIEERLGCYVAQSRVAVDLETQGMRVFFILREMPRALAAAHAATGCGE